MSAAFRFIEDPHGYFLGDEELPSPSKVFADLGLVDPRFYTPGSRARGRAVHAGIHYALKGTLDWKTLHEDLHGYVHSGVKLINYRKPRIVRFETPMYHEELRFGGTADIEWELDNWPWIVDWKTGKAPKVTRYQSAAYAMLAQHRLQPRPHKRAAVELQKDGSMANLVPYRDYTDTHGWLTLLNAYRIRQDLRRPPIEYVDLAAASHLQGE